MNESGGDSESLTIKADPKHKKIAVLVLVGILGLGGVVITTAQPYLENWLQAYKAELPDKSREELASDYQFFTSLVAVSLVFPVALLATVFGYQGYRVYDSNQYPYPRMMILQDTPLETGAQARRRGRRFFILAGFLLLSGCVMGWYLYAILMRLLLSVNTSL